MREKVLDTLFEHCSYRAYLDKPVEEEKLHQIIRAIQSAPNWVNIQHTSIVAIKDATHRKKLAGLCGGQKQIAQAPVFLVFCADFYKTALACKKYGQNLKEIMEDKDHLLVAAHEMGIALGTAVIAAEMLGLGTCAIGDVRLNALEMIEDLNLPKYTLPLLGLCIGYPAQEHSIKPRLPKEAVYFEETYKQNLSDLLEQYDLIYQEYLQKRPWNVRVHNWTQLVADFYKPPYRHYPETEAVLKKQGFLGYCSKTP